MGYSKYVYKQIRLFYELEFIKIIKMIIMDLAIKSLNNINNILDFKEITKLLKKSKNAIIFLYLFFMREDYEYGIFQNFKKISIKNNLINKLINTPRFSFLKNSGKIYEVLIELANANILISEPRNPRIYYKINDEIIIDDNILWKLSDYINAHTLDFGKIDNKWFKENLEKHLELISLENILIKLNKYQRFDYLKIIKFILQMFTNLKYSLFDVDNECNQCIKLANFSFGKVIPLKQPMIKFMTLSFFNYHYGCHLLIYPMITRKFIKRIENIIPLLLLIKYFEEYYTFILSKNCSLLEQKLRKKNKKSH